MRDKDGNTAMQILLVASAFALVLLYLYFTKGACWEMKGMLAAIAKFALIGAISLPTLCVLSLVGYSIWNSDKTSSAIFCDDNSIFYVSKNCSQIPAGCESVVVCAVDDLQNIKGDNIKDIYVLNPTGKVPAETLAKFKNAKIHFCEMGKTFCIEKIICGDQK